MFILDLILFWIILKFPNVPFCMDMQSLKALDQIPIPHDYYKIVKTYLPLLHAVCFIECGSFISFNRF